MAGVSNVFDVKTTAALDERRQSTAKRCNGCNR
jgi:hypothetical protein